MKDPIVVTISREYGSGGYTVGKNLANKLGVPFYDRDYISAKAKDEPFMVESNCEWLTATGMRPSTLIGSAFAFGPALGDLDSQFFLKESNVIWKLAKAGSCVIVGRCADFILRGRPHTYRLFISSGMAQRLRQIGQTPGLYEASVKREAKDIIRMDKRRATYYNYYTGQNWGAASNYDLCCDTGKIGPHLPDLLLAYIRYAESIADALA